MAEENRVRTGGISFFGLLTIVFITLKLCSVIDWSWWWVLAPLWIPASIALLILLFVVMVYFGCLILSYIIQKVE